MKRFLITTLACALTAVATAQQTIYTVVYNHAPEGKNFPVMIGGVNSSEGDQRGLQVGLGNFTQGAQQGTQMGLVNATGDDVRGAQFGLLNAFGGNQQGALFGIANGVKGDVRGAQFGILNGFGGESSGAQFGVLNFTYSMRGAQFGVINVPGAGMQGTQFGVINYTRSMSGVQFGVINFTRQYKSGTPVGILNIIGEGGYQAVEVGTSSLLPVNVAFKTGVHGFYTSIIAAYNPKFNKQMCMGVGIGSIVDISDRFYFNPEFNYLSTFEKQSASLFELHPNFGFWLAKKRVPDPRRSMYVMMDQVRHFSVVVAPTLSMQHIARDGEFNKPLYSLWKDRVDNRTELYVGLKVALRYNFNW